VDKDQCRDGEVLEQRTQRIEPHVRHREANDKRIASHYNQLRHRRQTRVNPGTAGSAVLRDPDQE
jgi:hypothetical protein